VVLVEKNAKAAEIARKNAELIRSVGKLAPACAQVVVNTVAHFLDGRADSSSDTGSFDLVFIDPPYDVADSELDDVLTTLNPHLSPGAEVVVERSTRSAVPQPPAGLTLDKSKAYGETTIHWLSRD
jgi:16S rRNA (guanine966-N2)-methyltransferase